MALEKQNDVENWVSSCEQSSDEEDSYTAENEQPKSRDMFVEPSPTKVRTSPADPSLSTQLGHSLVLGGD